MSSDNYYYNEELFHYNESEFKQFLYRLHKNLEDFVLYYAVLKSNIYLNQALRHIKTDFSAKKESLQQQAETKIVQSHPRLISSLESSNDTYEQISALYEKHKNDGLTLSNFIPSVFIGVITYYLLHYALTIQQSLIPKIIFLIIGGICAVFYLSSILTMCTENYQNEFLNAKSELQSYVNQYDQLNKQYLDEITASAWDQFLNRPDNQQLMKQAKDQTNKVLDGFITISDKLQNSMKFLPEEYKRSDYIEAMYKIVHEGRARNWTECAQQLKSEVNHEENIMGLQAINQTLDRNNEVVVQSLNQINKEVEKMSDQMSDQYKLTQHISTQLDKQTQEIREGFDNVARKQNEQLLATTALGTAVIGKMSDIQYDVNRNINKY